MGGRRLIGSGVFCVLVFARVVESATLSFLSKTWKVCVLGGTGISQRLSGNGSSTHCASRQFTKTDVSRTTLIAKSVWACVCSGACKVRAQQSRLSSVYPTLEQAGVELLARTEACSNPRQMDANRIELSSEAR